MNVMKMALFNIVRSRLHILSLTLPAQSHTQRVCGSVFGIISPEQGTFCLETLKDMISVTKRSCKRKCHQNTRLCKVCMLAVSITCVREEQSRHYHCNLVPSSCERSEKGHVSQAKELNKFC